MDFTQLNEKIQSKKYKKIVIFLAIIVAMLLVFTAGLEVGYMKASFNYRAGDSYYRTFGPGGGHIMGLVPPNDLGGAHGVRGKIVSVSLPSIVVADDDNTEKIVRINDDTVTRAEKETIQPSDLRAGDTVTIIGNPDDDDSAVDAKFIRVWSSLPSVTPAQPVTQ